MVDAPGGGSSGPSWAPAGAALAPVANRPLIAHAVQTLRDAGADEVAVVADHDTAGVLRDALRNEDSDGLRWVEVDAPMSAAEGILAAVPVLGDQRFLLHPADGLLLRGGGGLRRALAAADWDATVSFRRRAATDPVPLRGSRPAVRMLEAPEDGTLELDGVQALGPAFVEALRDCEPVNGRRCLLTALDRLAGDGGRVRAGVVDGWWRYSGTSGDLLGANHDTLDALDGGPPPPDGTGSVIEGRVQVHPTAEILGATIRGPALIGARARITDAYIGPYTSIGEDAVVENAEIEGSILLAGAVVRNVGLRIEASIVGRGAVVERNFRLPRAVRLLVGDGARIALS